MKKYQLDPEEEQILYEVENGEWVSIKNLTEVKKKLQKVAAYTIAKKHLDEK